MLRPLALATLIAAAGLTAAAPAEARPTTGTITIEVTAKDPTPPQKLRRAVVAHKLQNHARTDQTGSDHDAAIRQSGRGHGAVIHQRGSDHSASITQTGVGNRQGVVQVGTGTSADVVQTGTGARGLVIQIGW